MKNKIGKNKNQFIILMGIVLITIILLLALGIDLKLVLIDFGWILFPFFILIKYIFSKIKPLQKNIRWLFYISFIIVIVLFLKFYGFLIIGPNGFLPIFPLGERVYYKNAVKYSIIISILSLFLISILLGLTIKAKKYKQKLKLSVLAFFIAISSHVIFYTTNLDYVYGENPRLLMYSDGEYITNKDRYFSFVKKYGFDYGSYSGFKTLDDNIEALEFAKNNSIKGLYRVVFHDIEKFGYDKAFEKYKDKTFQVYFIRYLLSNNPIVDEDKLFIIKNYIYLKTIESNFIDTELGNISGGLYLMYNNVIGSGGENIEMNIRKIQDSIIFNVLKIEGINTNIF